MTCQYSRYTFYRIQFTLPIYQNRIADLLEKRCDCISLSQLPKCVHAPVASLFEFAFHLLEELKIRDRQYSTIYHSIPAKVCPFCGLEDFKLPGAKRVPLDHYLLESKYPFAGSNLHNLVPMGHDCNSLHKLQTNMLLKNGKRRQSINPYCPPAISISIQESSLFQRNYLPTWMIDITPTTEEVNTWEEVFQIRKRYRDYLDSVFMPEIGRFLRFFEILDVPKVADSLPIALGKYIYSIEIDGFSNKGFLHMELFRLLQNNIHNPRLQSLLLGQI